MAGGAQSIDRGARLRSRYPTARRFFSAWTLEGSCLAGLSGWHSNFLSLRCTVAFPLSWRHARSGSNAAASLSDLGNMRNDDNPHGFVLDEVVLFCSTSVYERLARVLPWISASVVGAHVPSRTSQSGTRRLWATRAPFQAIIQYAAAK